MSNCAEFSKKTKKCVRCKYLFHKLNSDETDCIDAGCKTGQYYSNIKKMCMYNCKDGQYFDDNRMGIQLYKSKQAKTNFK